MPRADKALLASWCEEQVAHAPEGTTSAPSKPPLGAVGSRLPSISARDLPWPPPKDTPVPTSFSISSCLAREGSGRAAIRAVLRAAASQPTVVGGALAGPDPEVTLQLEGDDPKVEVRYRSDPAWRRDWDAWLNRGLVMLPAPSHALAMDTLLTLRLVFTERLDLTCTGRAVLHHTDGLGVALDIDPARLCCPEMIDADPDIPSLPAGPTARPIPTTRAGWRAVGCARGLRVS